MKEETPMRRSVPALLAILGLLAAACGGAATPQPTSTATAAATAVPAVKVSLTIASFNFAESQILAEIFGQALAADGHTVQFKHKLGSREVVMPALEKGDINFVPEYLATSLAFVTKGDKMGDPAKALPAFRDALKPKGIAALEFAPAIDTNAFVVTKATAQKFNLKKMSDLTPVAKQLTLGAPPECPQRAFCLQGLKNTYGIEFKEFKPLDAGGPLTVAAVESGQVDVGLLFSTDAQIGAKGFVLLEDDKQLQAADNIIPVVRQDVLDKAGASFTTRINDISKKITTAKLTALNGKVSIDKKDPADVAKEFLKAEGLIK
jgi:osmoprotectant transport system substrate-binding protein